MHRFVFLVVYKRSSSEGHKADAEVQLEMQKGHRHKNDIPEVGVITCHAVKRYSLGRS